jgi:hypothetical protein
LSTARSACASFALCPSFAFGSAPASLSCHSRILPCRGLKAIAARPPKIFCSNKAQLRAEPGIARMVLRKLVGSIYLWDERERPDL